MFAKIFDTIYDGSLRSDWKALVTFQQLLILSDPEGVVHKTPEAISARTAIPLDMIQHGLEFLSKPDPKSRSKESEGRRIVLIDPLVDWGWQIVNFAAYRNIKTSDDLRDYWRGKQREHRTATLVEKTADLKGKISEFYKRRVEAQWSYAEETALCEIARRVSVFDEFSELKSFRSRQPKYFPQSVEKLLEGWNTILDRSRNGVRRRDQNI